MRYRNTGANSSVGTRLGGNVAMRYRPGADAAVRCMLGTDAAVTYRPDGAKVSVSTELVLDQLGYGLVLMLL